MIKRYRRPYKVKRRKSITKLLFKSRLFWLAILLLIFLGTIFYFIFFSLIFQIKEIKISGNQKVQTQDIENFLYQRINQKLLFLRTKSIFLINLGRIQRNFLETFPQVEKIDLKRKLPSTIIAAVHERQNIGIWCQENNECFLIDKMGVIFERTVWEDNSENMILMIRSDDSPELFLGKQVIEEAKMKSILKIQENLGTNFKIISKEFFLKADRINVKIAEGWEIYFSLKEDLEWQLVKLKAALEKEIPPDKRANLEYIDLRFGNFAPFRYKTNQPQDKQVSQDNI